MNRYEQEVPVVLPLLDQLKVREALSLRKRCVCSGRYSCDCYEVEALLRKGAEGQPLYQSQRSAIEAILERGRGPAGVVLESMKTAPTPDPEDETHSTDRKGVGDE